MNGIYAKLNAADEAAAKKDAEKENSQIEQENSDQEIRNQLLLRKSQSRRKSRRLTVKPSINITDTKEVDPVSKTMMLKAQT